MKYKGVPCSAITSSGVGVGHVLERSLRWSQSHGEAAILKGGHLCETLRSAEEKNNGK